MNPRIGKAASLVRRCARSLALAVAILLATSSTGRTQLTAVPGATPADARGGAAVGGTPHLPTLFRPDSITVVRGKISHSTRGHPGAVRLDMTPDAGGRLTVLVAPDSLCDALGLSLKAGERVDVTGSLLAGQTPILIATQFNVDGRSVRVRDDQGKLVKLSPTASKPGTNPSPAASHSSQARGTP